MNAKPFSQAVQWPSTIVLPEQADEFVAFIADEFNGTRAQYLFNALTKPDQKDGADVPGTGCRDDAYFAIHEDDIPKFAVPRIAHGMRWVDDVLANEAMRSHATIYEDRVFDLKSWHQKDAEYREDGSETGCVGE